MKSNLSKIEKMIEEMCPKGVEFKELGTLGDFYGGLTGKAKDDFNDGTAKYVTYMNIYSNIAVNTDIVDFVKVGEKENQNKIELGDVLFTGSSETPDECGISSVMTKNVNEPLYLNSFCFGFRLKNKHLFLPDFLKYLFRDEQCRKQIAKTASGVTRFNVSKKRFAKVIIPIPPLSIQQEIVSILDKFTELEAELEAELEVRKKQYEYYRENLLKFDNSVNWFSLNEVCLSINAGGDLPKNYLKGQKIPTEEYPYPIYSNGTDEHALYGYTDSYKVDSEAITVSARGTIGFHKVRAPKFTPIVRLITLIPNTRIVTTKFLNFILDITEIGHSGGSIPQLTVPNVKKLRIPVPEIEEQNKIAETLEKFNALVNDISIGLPAELNARRQQYEYYRNKLLTFKEYVK